MEGLKKDIEYLKGLVEELNQGKRNLKSVSGVITRIENRLNELDENFIPHIHLIANFKKIKASINVETIEDSINNDIKLYENMINSGVQTFWTFDDMENLKDKIASKLKKIKVIEVKKELEEKFYAMCFRELRETARESIILEIKRRVPWY